ncbi:Histidine kinase-, DNA gyrase B-, and HSP90-like ATPase [Pseudomonas arsenicoxydans]|uniref:Histidine kinase-, DNA gyrase B-, and HSP90-like ATPase n=1 Tax=Pseudomonas arsenicoxydans TaxID=702115 RepID=A0A1H0SKD5_9PSED|nr:ATP-binding protein [Pseudomonas arsenicoxydans]SDP42177.1 Histidine kinase-, DNA gyrase B-, and HSP90-like ATPase [Pseudomonas arsenicoxydans]
MREIQHPPHAASLMESMRSIGYTLESALADLIDNSISASAKKIRIEFRPYDDPYVAIIDDGFGMSPDILINAMRHGSTNPLIERAVDDMGRYGLGLKTSSLSQCRRMTVLSKKDNHISAYCWDLDIVVERGAWVMLELNACDYEEIPHFRDLEAQTSGTIVLWQKLDKLVAGEGTAEAAIGRQMSYAREHLALVFHRFLTKEGNKPKICIYINGASLPISDPFLSDHKSTQPLDEESFTVEGRKVKVKPFILPHFSKLSNTELQQAGGGEGFRNSQGFYIYRNRRLIIWGTWFRLARKDELSKLARVRVDIPNSLDHLWTLDIKKSAAHPPEAVRLNLKRTIERIRSVSGRTITFRGKKVDNSDLSPGWNEIIDRGGVRFEINREHSLIKEYASNLPPSMLSEFNLILSVVESSFPAEALYSRMASDVKPDFNSEAVAEKLRLLASSLFTNMPQESVARRSLLNTLHLLEPFNLHPIITKNIVEEFSI